MVLFIIGLGLADEKDITVKGLEAVKTCEKVYLEKYTAVLMCEKEKLEKFYGREVIEADREFVESGCDGMISEAKTQPIAFLVVGDPFCATTHSDLYLRCIKEGVKVEVIHNASIVSAMGCSGMQVYRFGEIISIPFFTETWKPYSFYDKIKFNREKGLHTLCLLDIKVKEPTMESLARGRPVYMPPRYMKTDCAAQQLMETVEAVKGDSYTEDTPCIGLARVGTDSQEVVSGPLKSFLSRDMGEPMHSFIICGEMHEMEKEMFEYFEQK
uniref:diphthine methyl ester synthase n=1 Tax=Strombidium rassoulzadegani TaxID=1082188 RepID=A0A7S3CJS0_9SPIT